MTPWSQTWGLSKLKYLNKTMFYRTVPAGNLKRNPYIILQLHWRILFSFLFFVKYKQRSFCHWIKGENEYRIITIYNTVILVRSVIKFLDSNFLFIEKVQAFLKLGTKYDLKRQKPSRYRENLSPKIKILSWYKFNFHFKWKKIFWKYPIFFWRKSENQSKLTQNVILNYT